MTTGENRLNRGKKTKKRFDHKFKPSEGGLGNTRERGQGSCTEKQRGKATSEEKKDRKFRRGGVQRGERTLKEKCEGMRGGGYHIGTPKKK